MAQAILVRNSGICELQAEDWHRRCLEQRSEMPMTSTLWPLWMAFILLILLSAVGYGWAYRGWGPPYPTYLQQRRARQALSANGFAASKHRAWGWRGDFVWVVFLIGGGWAFAELWLR
jgi:hypothetical protein